MSQLEPEMDLSEAESRLARKLLDSAHLDEPTPQARDAAWARFSSALTMVALHTSPQTRDPGGALSRMKRLAAASSSALQWLVVGAIAGSAITAAWLSSQLPSTATSSSAAASRLPAAPPLLSSAPTARAIPKVVSETRRESSLTTGRPGPVVASPSQPRRVAPLPPRSTLAAEVAQLDAARTALDVGALDEARRLLAQFQRDFPQGELAIEAQVMLIEVLSASADRAAVRREGARFLEKHQNDPHAVRVRQLTEDARKSP